MSKKEKRYENIKFDKKLVDRLRKHKKITGVPIGTFATQAINEKLDKHNNHE